MIEEKDFDEKLSVASVDFLKTLANKMSSIAYVEIKAFENKTEILKALKSVYYKNAELADSNAFPNYKEYSYYLSNPFDEGSKSFTVMRLLLQKYGFNSFLKDEAKEYIKTQGLEPEDVISVFNQIMYQKSKLGIFGKPLEKGKKFKFRQVITWKDKTPIFAKKEK